MFSTLFALYTLSVAFYMPTLALSNSVAFNALQQANLDTIKDIHVPAVEVNFTCCPNKAQALAEVLVKFLQEKGWADDFRGSIDYNPLRKALRHGAGNVSDEVVAQAKKLVETVAPVKGLRVLSVDSNVLSNAGAYIFQELGYALAWGADWMTLLTDALTL